MDELERLFQKICELYYDKKILELTVDRKTQYLASLRAGTGMVSFGSTVAQGQTSPLLSEILGPIQGS